MQVLCRVDEINPEAGKELLAEGPAGEYRIIVFRKGGAVRAYLDVCPHQGRSLCWAPGEFLFGERGELVCPHHGASFDLDTGECVSGPCEGGRLTRVAVEVEDGLIRLPAVPE